MRWNRRSRYRSSSNSSSGILEKIILVLFGIAMLIVVVRSFNAISVLSEYSAIRAFTTNFIHDTIFVIIVFLIGAILTGNATTPRGGSTARPSPPITPAPPASNTSGGESNDTTPPLS